MHTEEGTMNLMTVVTGLVLAAAAQPYVLNTLTIVNHVAVAS